MKKWTGVLLLAGMASLLQAQVPAPPAPAAAAGVAGAAAPGFIEKCQNTFARCKEKFCQTQLGKMVSNGMAPIQTFTGGMMPECCPPLIKEDLKKPADSAEGAAARIMADEAGAKARRQAVRFLGTVDCHYWPEAEAGLIAALRTDKNECVRMEAAWALGSGCCCTKKTVEALAITVSGSDKDGNAAEKSQRVKNTAYIAIEHCLACFNMKCQGQPAPQPGEKPLEKPKAEILPNTAGAAKLEATPTAAEKPKKPAGNYYDSLDQSEKEIYEKARKMLDDNSISAVEAAKKDHSLIGIVKDAFAPSTTTEQDVNGKPQSLQPVASKPQRSGGSGIIDNLRANRASQPMPYQAQTQADQLAAYPEPSRRYQSWRPAQAIEAKAPVHLASRPVDSEPKPVAAPAPAENKQGTVLYHKPPTVPAEEAAPKSSKPAEEEASTPEHKPDAAEDVKPVSGEEADEPSSKAVQPPLDVSTDNVPQMISTLQQSVQPEHREWAAFHLGTVDARKHPEAVSALVATCRRESVPTVRARCVRSLADLNAGTPEVVALLQSLKADASPKVRQEVHLALTRLLSSQAPSVYLAAPR